MLSVRPTVTLTGGYFQPGSGPHTVHINVEGRVFAMNRSVLCNASSFFHAMFAGIWYNSHVVATPVQNNGKQKMKHIELNEMSAAIFEGCAEYITHGKCTLDEDFLLPLLQAAHLLHIETLLAAAEVQVVARLCSGNALAAWQVADALSLSTLRAAAEAVILRHMPQVIESFASGDGSCCGASDHEDEAELHLAGCRAIARLCGRGQSHVYRRREYALASGAVEALVAIMQRALLRHATNNEPGTPLRAHYAPDIVCAAVCAMANVCDGPPHHGPLRAARAGGVALVSAARRLWPADEALQEAAGRLLPAAEAASQQGNLARDWEPYDYLWRRASIGVV